MPEQIDRLTIPRYRELERSWRRWPPPRQLLAMIAAAHGVTVEGDDDREGDDAVWDEMTLTPQDLAAMAKGADG
ncbi:MAG: hypothetical protein M0006_03305 [Magnetospirillum sp.]|nr:hypothetical protein [Magnetospirillum sp.]